MASYTRPKGAYGPTQTQSVTRTFEQRLRGVLQRINARIREFIGEKDWFNLTDETDTLAVDDPEPFETDSNPQKTALFLSWLREQLNTEFLTVVGPDRNQWLETAYKAGIRNVHRQLDDLDVAFEREDVNELVGAPIHARSLQTLYTRTYGNLRSVRDDMIADMRETITEGFRDGKGPREIASELTDRVDSIGKHRATMIARSETINAHTEGSLTEIDRANDEQEETLVVSHGEWDAAMDNRTCAFCRALNGVELSTDEMREMQADVTGGLPDAFVGRTFRLAPPAHPNCRCNVRTVIGTDDIDTPLDDRLPDGVTT